MDILKKIDTYIGEGAVPSTEKTVNMKHKTSGKEVVVVSTAVKKYEKMGYVLEAKRKSKFDYELYHDTYTSAVDTALKHAEVKGYTTDPEEVATYVGFGPRKPSRGKSVTVHIPLYKNGKPQKKQLHIVVYNRDVDRNTYELTAYIL